LVYETENALVLTVALIIHQVGFKLNA